MMYSVKIMRVFKTKPFERFARKERIADKDLCEAVKRADKGAVDADLGGGVVKQRLARKGQGRSGGYRTIIAYRRGKISVFMFGFAKSARDNINVREVRELQDAAAVFLGLSQSDIGVALNEGRLIEVDCDG